MVTTLSGPTQSDTPLRNERGFTFVELLTVIVIIGIIAGFALFAYNRYLYKAEVITAVSDLAELEKQIYGYTIDFNGSLPPDLNVVTSDTLVDPWGGSYYFQPDLSITPRTKLGAPINSDYDLYSRGKDGQSVAEITDNQSLDDIIRANEGQFKGVAARY